MILVIVESPGKIKKIQSILGSGYLVKASVGHLQDLDASSLSIDIREKKNGGYSFEPQYAVLQQKKSVVTSLRKLAKECHRVIIASDEDREGEFIAFSIMTLLNLKDPQRIVFNEITRAAITEAMRHPRSVDMHKVDSQKTRRILDRLIGYKIQPLLRRGFTAGRVQSVVVGLIVEKEDEIKKQLEHLSSTPVIEGCFEKMTATLAHSPPGMSPEEELVYLANINPYYIHDVKESLATESPPPPFTTSTLQQAAATTLKFPVDVTMKVAQKLYEAGHITYMRTDSTAISKDFSFSLTRQIKATYGDKYYQYRAYKNNGLSQEAHECIRPTDITVTLLNDATDQEQRLYNLIWQRVVASQMASATYEVFTLLILNKDKSFGKRTFTTVQKNLLFDGFLCIYNVKKPVKGDRRLSKGETIKVSSLLYSERFNYSNSRYSEASLVKKMEQVGIGRPSTYVSTIQTILKRRYVIISDQVYGITKTTTEMRIKAGEKKVKSKEKQTMIGHEKKKFIPTSSGRLITSYLQAHFPSTFNVAFTSSMEESLDRIATGKVKSQEVLSNFYAGFSRCIDDLLNQKKKLGSQK